jgi:hypothetical protein
MPARLRGSSTQSTQLAMPAGGALVVAGIEVLFR